jgi:small acid-soluble spore protein F (minor alpha/beta-type SASP)
MKPKTKKQIKAEDPLKLEIAAELGLLEKVRREGWGSLSAKETGRIGGLINRRKQAEKLKARQVKSSTTKPS